MRSKEFSQNKKIPLKASNLALNTEPISSSRSGMYNNFQKSKTNNGNITTKKSQMTEINLNSLRNLSHKTELKDRETFSYKMSSCGAYFIVERIFKYIKPKISKDLYFDLKLFLSEELKNVDENGDINTNLQNSFNSITEIINMNIKNSRNNKRVEPFNSNHNPNKIINLQISSERKEESNEKTLKLSPRLIPNSKAPSLRKEVSSNSKGKVNKVVNHPSTATNKALAGKMKFEIKTSLYNEFKAITKTKLKNNANSNVKNTSTPQNNPVNNNKLVIKNNQLNKSDAKASNSKTNLINNLSNNTSTNKNKGKNSLRIPNEISINLKDIGDVKIKDNTTTSKNNSISKKNTNTNSDQTVSNNNSVKVSLVNNCNIAQNKDVLKEVKLNLDENLRPLLNFSYENFFNKESNESYSKQESSNEINCDNPSSDHKDK